ncbi:Os03g0782300, partial [Oryza sativa Japonica Group]
IIRVYFCWDISLAKVHRNENHISHVLVSKGRVEELLISGRTIAVLLSHNFVCVDALIE